jgi:hypothetical protein
MFRSLLVGLVMISLLAQGCATHRAATQGSGASGEAICWDPPPAKPAHPVCDWCRAHPGWAYGIGAGLLVAVGIVAAGAIGIATVGAAIGGMH